MEEKMKVLTLIKYNHKFGCNKYVMGRISGIGYLLSDFCSRYSITKDDNGFILAHDFSADDYDEFVQIVEELYPGLCVFNYQMKESE